MNVRKTIIGESPCRVIGRFSLSSTRNRPENGKLTGRFRFPLFRGKGKKLLIEGGPVSLLTKGTANIPAGVIPEGHHHIFIRCLAEGVSSEVRV